MKAGTTSDCLGILCVTWYSGLAKKTAAKSRGGGSDIIQDRKHGVLSGMP